MDACVLHPARPAWHISRHSVDRDDLLWVLGPSLPCFKAEPRGPTLVPVSQHMQAAAQCAFQHWMQHLSRPFFGLRAVAGRVLWTRYCGFGFRRDGNHNEQRARIRMSHHHVVIVTPGSAKSQLQPYTPRNLGLPLQAWPAYVAG